MVISKHSARKRAGFTLVEVVLAVGIAACTMIPVLGLIPTGLKTFRQAIDVSVGSQISQRVINESLQTDFAQLITDKGGAVIPPGKTGQKAYRYFDEQGNEVAKGAAVYQVNTRILTSTSLPGASYADLATVTVQIANNPGDQPIAMNGANLWQDSTFAIYADSGLVARNQ